MIVKLLQFMERSKTMSIFNNYAAPNNENSLYKDIPYEPDVVDFTKSGRYRIKYRGHPVWVRC